VPFNSNFAYISRLLGNIRDAFVSFNGYTTLFVPRLLLSILVVESNLLSKHELSSMHKKSNGEVNTPPLWAAPQRRISPPAAQRAA
jgi:hypothetical protein